MENKTQHTGIYSGRKGKAVASKLKLDVATKRGGKRINEKNAFYEQLYDPSCGTVGIYSVLRSPSGRSLMQ